MTFLIHWVPTCWCTPTSLCGWGDGWKTKKLGKLLLNYKGNINRCWITLLIFTKGNQLKAESMFLVLHQCLNVHSAYKVKLSVFHHLEVPPTLVFFLFSPPIFALCQWNIDYFQGWFWTLFLLSWRNLNWTVATLWVHVCVLIVMNRRLREWKSVIIIPAVDPYPPG